jgi:hypothetical protein
MRDPVTFIITTANNTRPMTAVVMRTLFDRTAEVVEDLRWDETANVTEIFHRMLTSHAQKSFRFRCGKSGQPGQYGLLPGESEGIVGARRQFCLAFDPEI